MPTTTARTLTRLAAAILLPCYLAGAGAGATAEPDQYPIWWSPALELESLDSIDERRRKRFWPERHDGVRVYKAGDTSTEPAEIENCWTLEQLPNDGYSTPIENDNRFIESLSRMCTVLDMLENATAAKVSHVSDFVMTAEALDYLPAMVNISPGCDLLCRQYPANERRIPLSRFEAEFNVETKVISELKVEGKTNGGFTTSKSSRARTSAAMGWRICWWRLGLIRYRAPGARWPSIC